MLSQEKQIFRARNHDFFFLQVIVLIQTLLCANFQECQKSNRKRIKKIAFICNENYESRSKKPKRKYYIDIFVKGRGE